MPAATARSSARAAAARPVTSERSTSASGPSAPRTAHWKRAASRVRRWDMPTTLRPPRCAPRRGRGRRSTRGRTSACAPAPPGAPTSATPSVGQRRRPRLARASANARPTSSSQSASPAGTTTSTQRTSPGTTSTAPPPLRRAPPRRRRRRARRRRAGCCRARAPAPSARTPTPRAPRATAARARARRWAPPRNRSTVQLTQTAWRGGGTAPSARAPCRRRRSTQVSSRGAVGPAAQHHRRLVEQAVALAHVARAARGHHVLPRVLAAAAARDDVVDALGRAAAVLAAVAVAGEDAAPVERRPAPVRHLHEVAQADHRRHRHGEVLGVERLAGVVEHVGLVVEHEHGGAAAGHHAQRLVGGVEHEGPRHRRNVTGATGAASGRFSAGKSRHQRR